MKKFLIFPLMIILLATTVFSFNPLSIISTSNYNGGMEDWCIRSLTSVDRGFGIFTSVGTSPILCTDSNSIPWLAPVYNGLFDTNEIPSLWGSKYGCCTKRSTDAHSGSYSAQIHKESKNDWYNFGQGKKFATNIVGGKIYTIDFFYKLIITSSEKRFNFNDFKKKKAS